MPEFNLRPEKFYDQIMKWFGKDDINFESHPAFSKKYHLSGEYRDVISYYFHDDILDLLSSNALLQMEGMNYYMILYNHNQLIPAIMLEPFLHLGNLLFELFKLRSKASEEEFRIDLG